MRTRIVAVDVGSVRAVSRFAWAAFDVPTDEPVDTGDSPASAVAALKVGIGDDRRAALLLESPLGVPVPDISGWQDLGKARHGEGNRPWSLGAGAGALGTGLVQAAWILQALAAYQADLTATTQIDRWQDGRARLLLAEAFVSGTGKPVPVATNQHDADATAAGTEFVHRLASNALVSDVRCAPQAAVNLLAAAAIWAGLRIDQDELRQDVLVVKVLPVRETEVR